MTRPSALAKFGIAGVLASALAIAAFVAPAAAIAATQTLTPSDDTFINSASPDNNNGGSASIFTGRDGRGGMMRGLIRFAMPTGLSGRVSVTNSVLTMTTQALGSGAPGTAARVDSLRACKLPTQLASTRYS